MAKVTYNFPLTERTIGAGTDPTTGLPVIDLDGLSAHGIAAPDQRYLIAPDTAVRLAIQLLAAADPALVVDLIRRGLPTPVPPVPPGRPATGDGPPIDLPRAA